MLVAKVEIAKIHVLEHMVHCSFSDSLLNIIEPQHDTKERLLIIATVQSVSKTLFHVYQQTKESDISED